MLILKSQIVHDHSLEFVESDDMVVINIVLCHYLVDLLFGQIVPQLCKGVPQSRTIDLLLPLSVEFLEKRGQTLRRCVLFNWESGGDELMVVDYTRLVHINLL